MRILKFMKKGENGVVSGFTAINVNYKKISTKELPHAMMKLTGQKIFSHGIPFSPIIFLVFFFPHSFSILVIYRAH